MRQPLPRIFITAALTGNLTKPEQTPHLPITPAQSYLAGGHVRVGMEDGIYLSRGVLAPSNAAMVAKIRGVAEALGASIATSAQAREMLGLPQRPA